jgi:hypothetical protein
MNSEERDKAIVDAINLMKQLLLLHEERLDNQAFEIKNSRKDFDFKMNALIDAQLKNEEGFSELRRSIQELRDESMSQMQRIQKLESR